MIDRLPSAEPELENALLRAQLESSPEGVLVVGPQREVVYYNQRFLQMWGVPEEVIATRSDERTLASMLDRVVDPQAFLARIGMLYADHEQVSHEDVALADGRVFDRYTEPLRIREGEPPGRIFFFRDVTARKHAELALAQERDLSAALVDSLPGYFVLFDAAGHLVSYNANMAAVLGGDDDAVEQIHLDAIVAAPDRPRTMAHFRSVLRGEPVSADFPIVTRAGERRIVMTTARRIDRDGEPFVMAVGQDVTEARLIAARLEEHEARLRAIFDYVSDGIMLHDLGTFAVVDANPRIAEMFGYGRDEIRGMDLDALTEPTDARMRETARRNAARAREGAPQTFEWHARAKDGRAFWVEVALRRVRFGDNDYLLSTAHDITERKRAADELAYRDRILHAITTGTTALVASPSLQAGIMQAFQALAEVLAVERILLVEAGPPPVLRHAWEAHGMAPLGPKEFAERRPTGVEADEWVAPLRRGEPVVTRRPSAGGSVRAMLERQHIESQIMVPVHAGDARWGALAFDDCKRDREWSRIEMDMLELFADVIGSAVLRDRTRASLEQSEERFRALAREDPLTGLPNRRVFVDAVEQAIARARRGAKGFAVLYLDLDHFKDINDTLGHPTGDLLLQGVAERLRAAVRGEDVVARFGGDEFAVIAIDAADGDAVVAMAERIQTTLRAPFSLGGSEVRTGASIGVALYGVDSSDAVTLLAHADVALYRAKADGRGTCRFFTEAMDTEVRTRVRLGAELREAIEEGQLFLVYQPQVDLATRRIVGVEALVRWRNPRGEIVSPGAFIPVAERSGLIVALGRWVLREACRQGAAWCAAGIAPPTVAVNVSALQLKTPHELERTIVEILEETGFPADRLELEITESILMAASSRRDDSVKTLRAMGIKIAIDDFGTGFSSLEYLSRFPVDRIKVAQCFVSEIDRPENAAIIKATLGLARELGLDVVAEGVEDERQLALLERWGCPEAQGYHFSRPLAVGDIDSLLRCATIGSLRRRQSKTFGAPSVLSSECLAEPASPL